MWNVKKKKIKIKNIHKTILVKAHNFCLDKLASEPKWAEIFTLLPIDGFMPHNRLVWIPVKSVLVLLTWIRQNCSEIGSASLYRHAWIVPRMPCIDWVIQTVFCLELKQCKIHIQLRYKCKLFHNVRDFFFNFFLLLRRMDINNDADGNLSNTLIAMCFWWYHYFSKFAFIVPRWQQPIGFLSLFVSLERTNSNGHNVLGLGESLHLQNPLLSETLLCLWQCPVFKIKEWRTTDFFWNRKQKKEIKQVCWQLWKSLACISW